MGYCFTINAFQRLHRHHHHQCRHHPAIWAHWGLWFVERFECGPRGEQRHAGLRHVWRDDSERHFWHGCGFCTFVIPYRPWRGSHLHRGIDGWSLRGGPDLDNADGQWWRYKPACGVVNYSCRHRIGHIDADIHANQFIRSSVRPFSDDDPHLQQPRHGCKRQQLDVYADFDSDRQCDLHLHGDQNRRGVAVQ